MPEKTKWTILTYIAAHNNLADFGKKSLLEILSVGSSAGLALGALYDAPAGAGRYIIGSPGKVQYQEQLGSFDSGEPDGLIDTAKWLFAQCPAERYGLVLWSHGSGWEPDEMEEVAKEARPGAPADPMELRERAASPGSLALFRTTLRALLRPEKPAERAILFDDGTGHSLDTLELGRVTGAIADSIGQPLELLGMDACLMGNLEVAYEVREAVRCLVASEELVPAHSWPYQPIFTALRDNPEVGGTDFGELIVEQYVNFYDASPPGAGDITKVALDLGQIGGLVHATDLLAESLRADMGQAGDVLWKVQRATRMRESQEGKRKPNKFDYHLWDIGSLAAALSASADTSTAIKQAAANMAQALLPAAGSVLAEGHRGSWFDGIGGASVYLIPPGKQRIAKSYAKLAFARETRWHDMLSAYHAHFD